MEQKQFTTRECFVLLEPMTPQKQLALSKELKNVINERNMLTTRTRSKVLKALDEINSPENGKTYPLKEQALRELLDSEVNYLKQLETLMDFFVEPVKKRKLLCEEDISRIFGNVETIYRVNGELLNELKKDGANVGEAFKNMAPCFKLYAMYAYGYKAAMGILERAAKKDSLFTKFVKLQESRPEVQSKLSSLLIAPIQRIPRYRLLLKQVLDYTSPVDADYLALKSALEMIEEAAKRINRLVEEEEHSQSMLQLQRCLVNQQPSLIKPGRRIIKQGLLNKMSQNGTHSYKRYFVLMSDIIMYCKVKGSDPKVANSLVCSAILPLSKCKITEILNKGSFRIDCQEEELTLYHESLAESEHWATTIKATIKRYTENRLTLRKENTIRRPVKRKHLDLYEEPDLSPGRPLRKRLLLEKEQFENVYKTIADDSEASDCESKNCFKISKRKSIKGSRYTEEHTDSKDSLYPMRTAAATSACAKEQSVSDDNKQVAKNDVFVFGSNKNETKGFTFKMGSFFRGVMNVFNRFR